MNNSEINEAFQLKLNLIAYIHNSFKTNSSQKISIFKVNIIALIKKEFDQLIKDLSNSQIKKPNVNDLKKRSISTISRKIIIIPHSFGLNYYTTKDIQNENKGIIRFFEKKSMGYIRDNERPKHKTIATFLKDVAYVSRRAFLNSHEIFNCMQKEYLKEKGKNNNVINDIKDFSHWIKNKEKNSNILYNEFLKNDVIDCSLKEAKILLKELYKKLLILYFHCALSSPPIEINFKIKEDKYNGETMIDFLNYGNGKINFSYIPSLYSNGNYLENSKLWVYTYKENEFFFPNNIISSLNRLTD